MKSFFIIVLVSLFSVACSERKTATSADSPTETANPTATSAGSPSETASPTTKGDMI